MPDPSNLRDDVPDSVKDIYSSYGVIDYEDQPEAVADLYRLVEAGKCMLCEQPVNDGAVICVGEPGITLMFCSPVCLTDMMNMQFLGEIHGDLVERIEFRKGSPL